MGGLAQLVECSVHIREVRGSNPLLPSESILGHTGVGVTCGIYRHVATQELHEEHLRFAPFNGVKTLAEGQ